MQLETLLICREIRNPSRFQRLEIVGPSPSFYCSNGGRADPSEFWIFAIFQPHTSDRGDIDIYTEIIDPDGVRLKLWGEVFNSSKLPNPSGRAYIARRVKVRFKKPGHHELQTRVAGGKPETVSILVVEG